MIVLFVSTDLIFYSKVSAAAQQQGLQSRMVPRPEAAAGKIEPAEVAWVVIDLFNARGDVEQLAQGVRERFPSAQLCAFGPHVDKENLEAARRGGLDRVLTRGQMHSLLPTLFAGGGD